MSRRILILQGHPDPAGAHFGHALADSYAAGAREAGHELRRIEIAKLDFPLLRSQAEWRTGAVPAGIAAAQDDIRWAEHIVILYPLWLGTMPALLKAFLEQALRPGFALAAADGPAIWRAQLKGRSARIVVTMGMPALVYRWWFGAHSLKSLERNILGFCGIRPIRESLVGMVEGSAERRARWLERLQAAGRAGD